MRSQDLGRKGATHERTSVVPTGGTKQRRVKERKKGREEGKEGTFSGLFCHNKYTQSGRTGGRVRVALQSNGAGVGRRRPRNHKCKIKTNMLV